MLAVCLGNCKLMHERQLGGDLVYKGVGNGTLLPFQLLFGVLFVVNVQYQPQNSSGPQYMPGPVFWKACRATLKVTDNRSK